MPPVATSTAEREAARPTPPSDLTGSVAWSDGVLMVSGTVAVSDTTCPLRADGTFSAKPDVESISGILESGRVTISIQPACWLGDPFTMEVQTLGVVDGSLRLAAIVVPASVDVVWHLEATAVIRTLVQENEGKGLDLLAVDAGTDVGPILAHGEFPLRALDSGARLRVPMARAVRFVCRMAGRRIGGDLYLYAGAPEALSRAEPRNLMMRLDDGNLLRGSVHGPSGEGLPGARVDLSVPSPLTATGHETRSVYSDDRGTFTYLGPAGEQRRASATFLGVTSPATVVAIGQSDVRLTVDLANHRRVRLVRSGRPLDAFECGRHTQLFGRQSEPRLTSRVDGLCWLPPWREDRPIFATWRDEYGFREQEVPVGDSREVVVIDVDALPRTLLSTVRIAGLGGLPRYYVQLRLLDPLSALPVGDRQAGFREGVDPLFLGVPRGRYQLLVAGRSWRERGRPAARIRAWRCRPSD